MNKKLLNLSKRLLMLFVALTSYSESFASLNNAAIVKSQAANTQIEYRSLVNDLNEALNDLERFDRKLINSDFSSTEVKIFIDELNRIYFFLFNANESIYKVSDLNAKAETIIDLFTNLKFKLKDSLSKWNIKFNLKTHPNGKELFESVRKIFRAIRYFEDVVIESKVNSTKDKVEMQNIKSKYSWYNKFKSNSPLRYQDFKSGDVILMRGSSPVSASIARISDFQTQFSHIAIVHDDLVTNQKYVVESLIETGVIITPLKEFLTHRLAKYVVYRHQDQRIAQAAGEGVFTYVLKRLKEENLRISYDFSMNMSSLDKMFCSEVVSFAFKIGVFKVKGKFDLDDDVPMFKNSFHSKLNRSLLREFTIADSTNEIFAPGDIDIDPRFEEIAEYRDLDLTERLRITDLIFDKLFYWIEAENRKPNPKIWMSVISKLAYYASLNEKLKSFLAQKGLPIDSEISPQITRTVILMEMSKREFLNTIITYSNKFKFENGISPSPQKIYEKLEEIKANKSSKVLKYF